MVKFKRKHVLLNFIINDDYEQKFVTLYLFLDYIYFFIRPSLSPYIKFKLTYKHLICK